MVSRKLKVSIYIETGFNLLPHAADSLNKFEESDIWQKQFPLTAVDMPNSSATYVQCDFAQKLCHIFVMYGRYHTGRKVYLE